MAGKESNKAEETKELAQVANTGIMDFMADDVGSSVGFEGADKDSFAIPFLQVLQKMSPMVDEDDAAYVKGAKAGMFYNSVTGRLYDGKAGLIIIPCAYQRSYIRWGGRESGNGGFKGVLTVEQFEAIKADESQVKVIEGRYYAPNEDGSVNEKKNDYFADTRSHFVIAIDPETGEYGQAIISLSSSQIKASKKLMTSLQQKKVQTPGGLRTPPTFANQVRMTTVGLANEKGSWSGVQFELDGLVSDKDIYNEAKSLWTAVVGGSVGADYSKADPGAQPGVDDKPQTGDDF